MDQVNVYTYYRIILCYKKLTADLEFSASSADVFLLLFQINQVGLVSLNISDF